MSRLLETICVKNGTIPLLEYHHRRMQQSIQELFDTSYLFPIEETIEKLSIPPKGLYKVRLFYSQGIDHAEYEPYNRPIFRSVKLIEDNTITYPLKYRERKDIDNLYSRRGSCDEVIILQRGKLTDSTVANLAFFREGIWYTPAESLLKGTQQTYLIEHGKVEMISISIGEIGEYTQLKFINAMNPLDETYSYIYQQREADELLLSVIEK